MTLSLHSHSLSLLNPLLHYSWVFEIISHISFVENFKFTGYAKRSFFMCHWEITINFKLSVDVVSTDRHLSIKKMVWVDSRFNQIEHQSDPWYTAKGLPKEIMEAASKKSNLVLKMLLIMATFYLVETMNLRFC